MIAIPFVVMFLVSLFYPPCAILFVFLLGLTIQERDTFSNLLLLGLSLFGAFVSIKVTKFLPTLIPSSFGETYWLKLLLLIFLAFCVGRLVGFLIDLFGSKKKLQGS